MLLDATGATIGKVVDVEGGGALVEVTVVMDFSGKSVLARVASANLFQNVLAGFWGAKAKVWFESDDCSDTGYLDAIEVEQRSFFDSLTSGIIVGENQFDERRLYIPSDDATTTVAAFSALSGECISQASNNPAIFPDAVRLLLLDTDLHTTFPKRWYDFHEFGWYLGNVGQSQSL